jgi:hypothetical protein
MSIYFSLFFLMVPLSPRSDSYRSNGHDRSAPVTSSHRSTAKLTVCAGFFTRTLLGAAVPKDCEDSRIVVSRALASQR